MKSLPTVIVTVRWNNQFKKNGEKEMRSFIILLILLHIIPFLITQLILCDRLWEYNNEWQKWVLQLGTPLNFVVNFISLFLSYVFAFDIKNPFHKVADLLYLQCSYQDVGRLGMVLVVSTIIAILTGTGGITCLIRNCRSSPKGK